MYGVGRMRQGQSEYVVTAVSYAREAEEAAQELARQLMHSHLGFVLFFCSAEYDLHALGDALQRHEAAQIVVLQEAFDFLVGNAGVNRHGGRCGKVVEWGF